MIEFDLPFSALQAVVSVGAGGTVSRSFTSRLAHFDFTDVFVFSDGLGTTGIFSKVVDHISSEWLPVAPDGSAGLGRLRIDDPKRQLDVHLWPGTQVFDDLWARHVAGGPMPKRAVLEIAGAMLLEGPPHQWMRSHGDPAITRITLLDFVLPSRPRP